MDRNEDQNSVRNMERNRGVYHELRKYRDITRVLIVLMVAFAAALAFCGYQIKTGTDRMEEFEDKMAKLEGNQIKERGTEEPGSVATDTTADTTENPVVVESEEKTSTTWSLPVKESTTIFTSEEAEWPATKKESEKESSTKKLPSRIESSTEATTGDEPDKTETQAPPKSTEAPRMPTILPDFLGDETEIPMVTQTPQEIISPAMTPGEESDLENKEDSDKGNDNVAITSVVGDEWPLRHDYDRKSKYVEQLQDLLIQKGIMSQDTFSDGVWGDDTQEALKTVFPKLGWEEYKTSLTKEEYEELINYLSEKSDEDTPARGDGNYV